MRKCCTKKKRFHYGKLKLNNTLERITTLFCFHCCSSAANKKRVIRNSIKTSTCQLSACFPVFPDALYSAGWQCLAAGEWARRYSIIIPFRQNYGLFITAAGSSLPVSGHADWVRFSRKLVEKVQFRGRVAHSCVCPLSFPGEVVPDNNCPPPDTD